MQKVPINLVLPGMVLAKPVLNEQGMPLCAEGTELTVTLIDRLKRMNVSFLTLKGNPVDMGGMVKSVDEKIREMRDRFARVQGNPIMDRIRDAIEAALVSEASERSDEQVEEGKGEPGG